MPRKSLLLSLGTATAIVALALAPSWADDTKVQVDEGLPDYKPVSGVSGTIKSVGSDTMNNLMTFWAEGFKKIYPSVEIEIEGKGSATAPPALIEGTATFGPMSREMKKAEIDEFKKRYGYQPTALPTSLDMLAVYVNKDNPIAEKGLSLDQLDAIFSKNRKAGYAQDIKTWGDLGLSGRWQNEPIRLYGRNAASGTYAYLKEHVLKGGDYKDTVKEQPGSSAVVQSVAKDEFGIGYSGIGYKTADVHAVPLANKPGAKRIAALPKNAGDYPLARYLYIYVNAKPKSALDPLRAEFIKYVFSKQGQLVVIKDGYLPVGVDDAKDALKSVGLAK
jgi:phosphate transport system substrate-binding protein